MIARNIYFIGTAGSGKSSLANAFRDWMGDQDLDSVIVNLDPGAENPLYVPDVDIRDWIKLEEVMEEYGLGPNGAQIICADMIALNVKEVADVLETYKTNYILFDTPGQMELFTFREASRAIVEAFGYENSFIVFLSDATLAKTPNGLLSLIMLSATTQFRFYVPLMNTLSKSDLLSEEELDEIQQRSSNPQRLYSDLYEEKGQSVVSIEIFKALENAGLYKELTPVSSINMTGFGDVYNGIQQFFEGGEDLLKD